MFIYIKTGQEGLNCKFQISEIRCGGGFYAEAAFRGLPSIRTIGKALAKCPGEYPIVSAVHLPQRYYDRLFCCDGFDKLLLVNTFAEVCSHTALVIDPEGTLADFLCVPLSKTQVLYAVTENGAAYDAARSESLRTVGSAAVITKRIPQDIVFSAVLCAENTAKRFTPPRNSVVFGDGGYLPFGDIVRFRGGNIDRQLAAALLIVNGDSRMSVCVSPLVCRAGKVKPVEALKTPHDNRPAYPYNYT